VPPNRTDAAAPRALAAAYPEMSDKARDELERWLLEQSLDEFPVLDILLMELHALHKLLRTTYSEGMTWLFEVLEQERQSLAARSAYLLRNSYLPNQTRTSTLHTGPGLSCSRLF